MGSAGRGGWSSVGSFSTETKVLTYRHRHGVGEDLLIDHPQYRIHGLQPGVGIEIDEKEHALTVSDIQVQGAGDNEGHVLEFYPDLSDHGHAIDDQAGVESRGLPLDCLLPNVLRSF